MVAPYSSFSFKYSLVIFHLSHFFHFFINFSISTLLDLKKGEGEDCDHHNVHSPQRGETVRLCDKSHVTAHDRACVCGMQGPATLHTFAAIVRLSGFNEDLASMLGAKLTTRLQSMTPPQLLRDTDQTTIARLVNEIIAADDYLQLQVAAMHNRSQRLQAMSLESRMTALTLLAPDWLHKMPQDHFEPAKPITILFGSCRDGVDSDITPIAADDDLYYGKVDVAVPPRPVPCEADETASRCFRLGWHALKADIQSTVNSGTTHGFIFVHGFHNSFVNAAKTTAQLCADLADGGKDQARVVTFMFAWPSTTSMLGYGLAQTNKDASMLHFERFVAKVADEMAQYQVMRI